MRVVYYTWVFKLRSACYSCSLLYKLLALFVSLNKMQRQAFKRKRISRNISNFLMEWFSKS